MNDPEAVGPSNRLPWLIPPAVLPLWYAGVAWGWWHVFHAEIVSAAPAPASIMPPPALAAGLAVLGKALGHVSETGFYVVLWKAYRVRLPFWRFLAVVVSASMADQFAYSLGAGYPDGAPAWRAWLAGLHLAAGTVFHDSPAVRAGFGSLGLLTAARIGITAAAQARALNRGWMAALGVTAGVWLLTRLAFLWGVDLMRGMSPVAGG